MGCTVQTPQRPPAPPVPNSPVAALLSAGDTSLAANRLTTPREESAYFYYRQVLALEPDNQHALNGINTIVETYLDWALDHVESGNLVRARQYVTKAESIDARHPNIKAVVNRINDREETRVVSYPVDAIALRQRDATKINFDRIAAEIVRRRGFVTIRAPNDPDGRWLYQQLNERVSFRIQAKFERTGQSVILVSH